MNTKSMAASEARRFGIAMLRAAKHYKDCPIPEYHNELMDAIREYGEAVDNRYREEDIADSRRSESAHA